MRARALQRMHAQLHKVKSDVDSENLPHHNLREVLQLGLYMEKGGVDTENLPHHIAHEKLQQWFLGKGGVDAEDMPHNISREKVLQWLNLAKGDVDSEDMPLHITRETMQQFEIVHVMLKNMVKKCMRSTAYAMKEVIQPVLCLVTRPALVLAPTSPPMIGDDEYSKHEKKDGTSGKLMDVVFDQFLKYEGWTQYEDLYDDVCELVGVCVEQWVGLGIMEQQGEQVRMVRAVLDRYAG